MLSNFYFLNLMFKNNWFFFFNLEDIFFKDLKIFENLFYIDFFYFFNTFFTFSQKFLKLPFLNFFFKRIKQKKKKNITLFFNSFKYFILFSKGLFLFFKPFEKFLFFKSNYVWFFCFKSGYLKKRNIFTWNRVKKMELSIISLSKLFLFNSYKGFANVFGLNTKLFRGDIFFFIKKRKIFYVKIFNFLWKLVDNFNTFCSSNNKFFFNNNFTICEFFFFRLNNSFLKFSFPQKKIKVLNKFISSYKINKKKNFFFINFIERYVKFFSHNMFTINKKYFAIYKSLKFIWEFLINLINILKI